MAKKIMLVVAAHLCVFLGGPYTRADYLDIRVDLNEANSSPGGNWNVLADPSDTEPVLSLIDYNTGLDSGITLQVTDDFLKSSGYFPAMDAWANPAFPWVDVVALRDYAALVADNTTGQLEFAGLDPEKSYVVEILGIRDNVADYIGQCTVNGAYDDDNDSSSWNCYADGWVNTDGMVWENVSPDANGKIIVDATMTQTVFFLNACRLSVVPEPSAFVMLLAICGGLAVSRMWRHYH